jgi:hypothetical protein
MEIVVQYPEDEINPGDVDTLRAFDNVISDLSIGLFTSTLNPAWVHEPGSHTSPIYRLMVGDREVLRRTISDLRNMTEDEFRIALVYATQGWAQS